MHPLVLPALSRPCSSNLRTLLVPFHLLSTSMGADGSSAGRAPAPTQIGCALQRLTRLSPNTHDSLVSDLVREAGVAVAFPYYTPAPKAQFPQQFDEAYAAIEYYVKHGQEYGVKTDKIAYAGDSAGGSSSKLRSAKPDGLMVY